MTMHSIKTKSSSLLHPNPPKRVERIAGAMILVLMLAVSTIMISPTAVLAQTPPPPPPDPGTCFGGWVWDATATPPQCRPSANLDSSQITRTEVVDGTAAGVFFGKFWKTPLGAVTIRVFQAGALLVVVFAVVNLIKERVKSKQGGMGSPSGGGVGEVFSALFPAFFVASLLFSVRWVGLLLDLVIKLLGDLLDSFGFFF